MKNRITILTTFLLLLAGHKSFGQIGPEWVQRYDGTGNFFDYAYSLAVDISGNVYVTGASFGSSFSTDYATIKYNSSGDLLWAAIYDWMGNYDYAYSLAVDGAGNVYVTGASGNNYNYATVKYDSNGNELWAQRYNGNNNDYATSIAVDGSGNVYVTGGGSEYATIKYNSNGDSLWVKKYNGLGIGYDVATSLAVDGPGNVYVTGYSQDTSGYEDYATIKYDSDGVEQWVKRYNGPGNVNDHATSIAVDGSGNVFVTGNSGTIKYNSNGDSLWLQSHYASSLAVDGAGNVCVAGGDATIKYSSSGVQQWIQIYNGGDASSLAVDDAGNVYVTGTAYDSLGIDYGTIKYSSSGVRQWVQRYNGPENNSDYSHSIAVDGSGNVLVTGQSAGNGTFAWDYATIKYSSVPRTLYLTALIQGFYNNVTNKMISDTVRVYLRNSSAPYGIIDSATTVLDSTGNGTLNFFNSSNFTPYYIVIKHRNSIETWSFSGNSFSLNNMSYDFTTTASKAYGNNLILKGTKYCIYSGDVNQEANVDLNDILQVYNKANNFIPGYVNTDVNGDMITDLNDVLIAFNNGNNFVSVKRP